MAQGELMRRGDAMRLLGLSAWQWHKLVEEGRLRALPPLYKGARALFRRVDVEALTKEVRQHG